MNYDVMRITPALRNSCRKIIRDNRITEDNIRACSRAAQGMFIWVTSLVGMPELPEETKAEEVEETKAPKKAPQKS